MSEKKGEYKRLPGSRRSSVGVIHHVRHTLWLGPDHLLSVANQGYAEDYKRFYYRNIQAIIAHKTVAGKVWNIILAGIVFVSLLLAGVGILYEWHFAGVVILASSAALFGLILAVNSLRGPTCICSLHTAVQTERLHSLHRLRLAMRVIEMLRETVESVQGRVDADSVSTEELTAISPDNKIAVPAGNGESQRSRRPALSALVGYRSIRAHGMLCIALLADFLHNCISFVVSNVLWYWVSVAVTVFIVVSAVVALIEQTRLDVGYALKVVVWSALGYLFACTWVGMMWAVTEPTVYADTAMRASISPFESPMKMGMLLFSVICSGVLAVAGFVCLHRFRSLRGTPPPVPRDASAGTTGQS